MVKDNEDLEDVIVAFNGKDHKLKDWTKKEKAATDEDPSLNWRKVFEEHTPKTHLGESAPTGFVPYKKVKRKRRKGSKSNQTSLALFIKQFWVPFLAAIIVGLGIGFTVLIMFSHHKAEEAKSMPTTAQPAQQDVSDAVVETLDGSDFALGLQIIQGGSFDSRNAAQKVLEELKGENVPAAILSEDGKYKVIIGVAVDETTRHDLEGALGKVELYGKPWTFELKKIKASKQVGEFLKTGKDFISHMVPLSTAKELDKPMDGKTLSAINNDLGHWEDIETLNVKGTLKKDLTSFRGAVISAFSHLENKDDSDNAQQSLLDAISIYQKILVALSE